MSSLTNYLIQENHGEIFGTNAMEDVNLMEIIASLLKLDGIEDVLLNTGILPREFTAHTNKMVFIAYIENSVKAVGFHAIPKDLFEL